jgi:DNA (cytosine-5)-methyltransferase 1
MKLNAFDFFCGAGGLTRGLLDSGIEVIAGFDCDKECCESYEYNNPGVKFIAKDIRDVTLAELRRLAQKGSFKETIFVGCAPCQPFSQQRRSNKHMNDATLLSEFGRLVALAKPGIVLIENVPGITRLPGFSTFRRFLKLLTQNNYKFAYDIIDAKRYGIPQTRRRLVLIAARGTAPPLPKPKHGPTLLPFKTVRQTISHFPVLAAGECHPNVPNHVAASITPMNIERLKHTPLNGGDRRSWPDNLRLDCHKGDYNGHTDVYGRMAWDTPAPALTGRCHSISNGRYGHPEQNRAISLREAAALQTFPDGYVFFGSNTHIARQIGNAVPVRLAKELGKSLRITFLEKDIV